MLWFFWLVQQKSDQCASPAVPVDFSCDTTKSNGQEIFYFQNPKFPSGEDTPLVCMFGITIASPSICQIRYWANYAALCSTLKTYVVLWSALQSSTVLSWSLQGFATICTSLQRSVVPCMPRQCYAAVFQSYTIHQISSWIPSVQPPDICLIRCRKRQVNS